MTPNEVAQQLCEITKTNIFQTTRKRHVIEIRSLYFTILKRLFNYGWTDIARHMEENGKPTNHATIIHSVKSYPQYKKFNPQLASYESMFIKTFDDKIEFKDNVERLKMENERLKLKLETITNKNPLFNIISEIPNNRMNEAKERLELMIKSWEWKPVNAKTKIYDCSTRAETF